MSRRIYSTTTTITVDKEEIERFARIAEEWWNENGKFKPLHRMTPLRVRYIRDQACAHFKRSNEQLEAFAGLMALDVGCGGGLLTEPLCRLGAHVVGIDAGGENIRVATSHAEKVGLKIAYLCSSPEEMLVTGQWPMPARKTGYVPQPNDHLFDIVTALEIVEHVADLPAFIAACAGLIKPGGMLFVSTINRTIKSYLEAIVLAEHVLHWVPPETHQWSKFLRPSDLTGILRNEGLTVTNMAGMTYNPAQAEWRMSDSLAVNYILTAVKAPK